MPVSDLDIHRSAHLSIHGRERVARGQRPESVGVMEMIAEPIGGGLAQWDDPLRRRDAHPTRVKHRKPAFLPLIAVLALGGCAVALPSGPSVLAVPGQGKTLEAFQQDDVACRQYASERVGPAVAQASSAGLQRQYDMAYLQCMVAKGNTVPSLAAPPGYYAPYPRY